MHSRLSRYLASLLLVGMLASACGDDPQPSANKPPILTGPNVQSADVASGAVVTLSLQATDPENEALTYAWAQTPATPAGTFSDPAAASPTWTAPQVTSVTSFQLGGTVSWSDHREFGYAEVQAHADTRLLVGLEDFRSSDENG